MGWICGYSPFFAVKTAFERRAETLLNIECASSAARRAPHEVALIIRDAVRTPCKAAEPGIDAQQLVVRAVPQGSSSGSDTIMCRSAPRGRSCADLHQVAGSGLLQRCRNGRWSCYRRRPLKHVPRRRSPHWRAVQHERVGTTRADTHRAACGRTGARGAP